MTAVEEEKKLSIMRTLLIQISNTRMDEIKLMQAFTALSKTCEILNDVINRQLKAAKESNEKVLLERQKQELKKMSGLMLLYQKKKNRVLVDEIIISVENFKDRCNDIIGLKMAQAA